MVFDNENEFEKAVINHIRKYGRYEVLNHPTEADLIENWANIIYQKNKDVDTLNGQPLTETEMMQVIEQLNACRTPLDVNGFINGKGIAIIRDNPADELHLNKEVVLDIYDRRKIEAMESVYQIARQPHFDARDDIFPDRRGDFMLLINGMPIIHVELKKSGVDVKVACNQIETYSHEGIFAQGIFSLVQVFVAMTPEETLYFANPGQDGIFDERYFFHWADPNNKQINEWTEVVKGLLNIPMAHQLVGYYTVADKQDGVLKVMRSYQYYAASFIQSRVASREDWTHEDRYGGHIWHTTGSGKTMTSFKAALLIAEFGHADKVVFVVDRIDLSEQSFGEYKSYADDATDIQDTKNSSGLVRKLKSIAAKDTLIITSIQKLYNVRRGKVHNDLDIDTIASKRLVFIVDECHRDTFGEMYISIRNTFPCAMFFGFTGTPILPDNQKKDMTTAGLFGDNLHKYTIGCGIRDKNVLGFDLYKVPTYDDTELRQAVALNAAKVRTPEEALADKKRAKVYMHFMQDLPMGYTVDADGNRKNGIEYYVPKEQYERDQHRRRVVENIKKYWTTVSFGNRFHAILATSSIAEAIQYYKLMKELCPTIRATAIFDEHDDFAGNMTIKKEDALKEMLLDYKARYGKEYKLKQYDDFKKDVCSRLAHKEPYQDLEPEMQLDLVIVVEQLLTGYDSKWVNALYLDKKLEYQNIIQAFSRTNRLNGEEKKFGIIKYYRYPHTMEKNIELAIDMYSKDEPLELFVNKLPRNIELMNHVFVELETLFRTAGVNNFERLPDGEAEQAQFARKFKEWQNYIDSAHLQGFVWEKKDYKEKDNEGNEREVSVIFEHADYLALRQRYKELGRGNGGGGGRPGNVPFAIDTYITQIRTESIDPEYIDSRFGRYLHLFNTEGADSETAQQAREDLHKAFATLSDIEQKYAYVILSDIQKGKYKEGKSFRELLVEYQSKAEKDQIHIIAVALGVDEEMLRELVRRHVDESTIDEKGGFEQLMKTVNLPQAKECFESLEHQSVNPFKVKIKVDGLLRRFLFADDAGKEAIAKEIAGEYLKLHPEFNMGMAHELTLETAEIKINGDAKIETNQVHIQTNQIDRPLMAAESGDDEVRTDDIQEELDLLPSSTLDSIFHKALNLVKVKKAIQDIIIMKGEEGKFRLSVKQTFILHKVLEEIDWLDDDTDTTFIQWYDDVYKWPWKTRNFKAVLSPFKNTPSASWNENTVKDANTGREYRDFANYVRNLFVEIDANGKITDKQEFLKLGSDGKPMYIGHGLRRNS